MKTLAVLLASIGLLMSCVAKNDPHLSEEPYSPISGTWQLLLVETIEGGESAMDDYSGQVKRIKE